MIITQTPLRLSLFGGNTDFREYFLEHGGLCLTATIDKYIYCIVQKKFDSKIIINYTIKEVVDRVDDIKHDLVREALKLVGIEKGIEISFLADIPTKGTGLGSSSAVTVGVLNALHAYLGEYVSSEQLAEEAVKIELDILKSPIGVQDQYAVALGGLRTISFNKDGVASSRVAVPEMEDFNNSLMLFYTGIDRKAGDVLASVKLDKDELDKKKALAIEGVEYLTSGHLKEFGDLLGKSWKMKKEANTKTTNDEIDIMYGKALEGGAIGGKVIGAGGGGFLLVMFPANKRAKVRASLGEYRELPFRFSNFGSKVILNI